MTYLDIASIGILHNIDKSYIKLNVILIEFGRLQHGMKPLQYDSELDVLLNPIKFTLKGTKREILSAMHVKELIQSNHSER